MAEYGLEETKDEVKKWYDGFAFGGSKDIYNPWSITNYLDKKRFQAILGGDKWKYTGEPVDSDGIC